MAAIATQSITGKSSARKRMTKHGVKMLVDGTCPMPNCTYKCKSMKLSTFQMHLSMKHQVELGISVLTYKCGDCSQLFRSRSELNNHIERKHTARKWHCPHPNCSYVGQKCESTMLHYVGKHMGLKEADCVDENMCCVNCGCQRKSTKGNKYHIGICMGIKDTVKDYNDRRNRGNDTDSETSSDDE